MQVIRDRANALVKRLLPPGVADAEQEARSRFFVIGWLLACGFSAAAVVGYAAAGSWGQVVLSGALVVAAPLMLLGLRRGVGLVGLTHASLGLATAVFGLAALAQRPADYVSLCFSVVVPLLGSFILGPRRALPWLFVSLAWGLTVLGFAEAGWLFPFDDPMPGPSHALNFVFMVLMVWIFARSFDRVRQDALERLQQADRARSAFLATVSHEIRTPMNGVLGMTEVLLQDPRLSAEHREQLDVIQRSGRTLVALINDVLDVSKMEAGHLSLEQVDFSLDRTLADVRALAASRASQKGLSLLLSRDPSLPARLRGDPLRLGQVLTNLVSNAVKFTERGEVRLAVTCTPEGSGSRCRFEVTDTGQGIAPEVLPRLFTAFQQGDSSTTRRFGGTGLGLALSQQLVSLMGGQIQVESTPGAGSRFWFEVHLAAAAQSTRTASQILSGDASDEGPLPVLVVDDNPINLKVAVALLQRAGCPVEAASNGREALEAVQRRRFRLVLMDCHMPEMDGFEATERIRALPGEAGQTPVIALTASAMPEDLEACRRAGMNDVLAKPMTWAAVQRVLGRAGSGSMPAAAPVVAPSA